MQIDPGFTALHEQTLRAASFRGSLPRTNPARFPGRARLSGDGRCESRGEIQPLADRGDSRAGRTAPAIAAENAATPTEVTSVSARTASPVASNRLVRVRGDGAQSGWPGSRDGGAMAGAESNRTVLSLLESWFLISDRR